MTADRTDTGDRQGREALREALDGVEDTTRRIFMDVGQREGALWALDCVRQRLAALPPSVPDEEPREDVAAALGVVRSLLTDAQEKVGVAVEQVARVMNVAPSVPGPAPADEDGLRRDAAPASQGPDTQRETLRRAALDTLLSAVREITCTLDRPEGWTLGWHEAIELDRAERAYSALAAEPVPGTEAHEHDPFRCPRHTDTDCDCDRATQVCNPYRVDGHCPDDLEQWPVPGAETRP